MNTMRTYSAHIYREGKWWMIEIPELDGLTQARHLREAEKMAREYIAITLDVDEDSFGLDMKIDVPQTVQTHLDAATRLRADSARANAEAAEESRAAARELVSAGMTVRDAATVLGVTYQRVHQLVNA